MQAPVDYPIEDLAHIEQFSVDELAYAAHLDRRSSVSLSEVDSLTKQCIVVDLPDTHPEVKLIQTVKTESAPSANANPPAWAAKATKGKPDATGMLSRFAWRSTVNSDRDAGMRL